MRITKVYTRTGDDGTTGLANGKRVPKDSKRVRLLGSLDELNASIGVALVENLNKDITSVLQDVQNDLFNIGGEVSVVDKELGLITTEDVQKLENVIDSLNETLAPLKEFVVPGGSKGSALLHKARTVCRRAECDLVNLSHEEKINMIHLQYLNRFSDYLFVAARYQNNIDGSSEETWEK